MEPSEDLPMELPLCSMARRKVCNAQSSDNGSPIGQNSDSVQYVQSVSNPMVIKAEMMTPSKANSVGTSLHHSVQSIHVSCNNDQENYESLEYVDSPVVSIQEDSQTKFNGGLLSDAAVNFVEIDEQNLKSCGDSLDVYFDMIPASVSNATNIPSTSSGFFTRPEHQTPKASLLLRAYSDIRNSQAQEHQVSSQISVDSAVELGVTDHSEYLIPEILNANLSNISDVILPSSLVKGGKGDIQKKGIQIQIQQPLKMDPGASTNQHYDSRELLNFSSSSFPHFVSNASIHTDAKNHQVLTCQSQQLPHYQVLQKVPQMNVKNQNIEYILHKVEGHHSEDDMFDVEKSEQDFSVVTEGNNIQATHSKDNESFVMNNVPLVSRSGRLIRRKPEYIEYVNDASMSDVGFKDERVLSMNTSQRNPKSSELLREDGIRDSSLDEDSTEPCDGKKSLPHKKRIPKNLKRTKKVPKTLSSKELDNGIDSLDSINPSEIIASKDVDKNKQFVCELCKKDFDSQFNFFSHLKIHYEPSSRYKCDFCEEVFVSESLLTEHVSKHTREHLKCSYCHKTFRKQSALDEHISKAHSEPVENVYSCWACPETFANQFEFDAHYQEKHVQSDVEFVCENCYMVFDSKQKLQIHVRSQHKEEAKPRGAPKKSKKKAKTVFQCGVCQRTFTRKNSFDYHMRGHTGERPFRCQYCQKGFFAGSALKVHERMHTGEKPHECDKCGKKFRQWGDLHYHTSTAHSDARLYQCEFCGKDFKRKYCLVVHRRIHTGEKKYKCEQCFKGFRASSYLQNHIRIHTGEKPYACPECGKMFRVRSDMKRHVLTHRRNANNSRSNYSSKPAADPVRIVTSTQGKVSGTTQSVTTEPSKNNNNHVQILQGALSQGQLIITDSLESIMEGDPLRIVVSGMSTSNSVATSSPLKFTQSNTVALNRVAMTTLSPSSCDNSNSTPSVLLMDSSTQQPVNLNVIPRIITDGQQGNELLEDSRNAVRHETTNICVWPGVFNEQPQ